MKNKLYLIPFLSLPACTYAFDLNDIVNWTGTGSNEAAMVIDWQDGSAHPNLVWGFRWEGVATGEDMIKAIAAADSDLSVTITSYSFGDAVTAIGFDGSAYGDGGPGSHFAGGFGVGTPGFWAYYLGSGTSYPAWDESGTGMSDRILSNDSWDGWSWSANFVDTAPGDNPLAAPVPAPEPASLFALAASSLLLRRRMPAGRKRYRGFRPAIIRATGAGTNNE